MIAGLEDDGLVRASGESDGDGNKRFNLNDENVDIRDKRSSRGRRRCSGRSFR